MKSHFTMKKTKISIAIVAGLFLLSLNVNAQKEKREISGINSVSLSIAANLEISQGNSEELILIGDKNDLDKIETKVSEGHLKIYKKKGTSRIEKVKILLTIKDLEELSISGSGDVIFMTDFVTDDFELNISGSGNVKCRNIEANEAEISVAGSGDVLIGGELKSDLEINIAGSGDVNAAELKCQEVEVNIAGSGNAKVWAEESLESNIVGSGDVHYKGRPKVDSETTGSGSTRSL